MPLWKLLELNALALHPFKREDSNALHLFSVVTYVSTYVYEKLNGRFIYCTTITPFPILPPALFFSFFFSKNISFSKPSFTFYPSLRGKRPASVASFCLSSVILNAREQRNENNRGRTELLIYSKKKKKLLSKRAAFYVA